MAADEQQVQAEERAEPPEWVAEKFRGADNPVEAQARSYAEAEREMSRLRSEYERQQKEFSEALSSLAEQERQQPYQQQQYQPQADPLLSAAQRAYEEGDVTTLLAIQAQISQAATAQILDQRLGQFDERFQANTAQDRELSLRMAEEQVQRVFGEERWGELAPKVQQELQSRPLPPTPSVEGYASHILDIARLVDYDRLTQANANLERERQAKLNAQTLENGAARVPLTARKDKDAWEEIKSADAGGWNSIVGNG
jgi:hypothetical protein